MSFPSVHVQREDIRPSEYSFLSFLDERTDGGKWAEGISPQEWIDEGVSASEVAWAVRSLIGRGCVRRVGEEENVNITQLGVDVHWAVVDSRNDIPLRLRYVRTVFMRGVYRREHAETGQDASYVRMWHDLDLRDSPERGPTLWDLYTSGTVYAFGEYITGPELLRVSQYLEAKGYLLRWPGANWTKTKVSLTVKGIDCVESGESVHEFEKKSDATKPVTYLTHIADAQGVIIGQQADFAQNNSKNLDTTQIASFAALVRQIAPTLGMEKRAETQLDQDALLLHDEAATNAPDRSHLRKLLDAVMAGLSNAAPTVASQMAISLGQDVIKAIGHN